ncbi:hypothetical protein MNBD_BACTEROID07-1277 [hydrothermal vent metagenome]|uniref:Uncharacterized protein n=1 Tax=hydrothermal vent metagenome TaxID=652676 RepID=A0A3B0V873_9ZZZZ
MNKWDERYAQESYLYGAKPNDFLKENFQQIIAVKD